MTLSGLLTGAGCIDRKNEQQLSPLKYSRPLILYSFKRKPLADGVAAVGIRYGTEPTA